MPEEVLAMALKYAVDKHHGVYRDGETPVPYACHPVEVMLTLRHRVGITDEHILAAALLHDVVEDTTTTIQDIESVFGPKIAKIVQQVTRDEPESSQTKKLSKDEVWQLRTQLLISEIKQMTNEGHLIKLSDRLSNICEAKLTRSPEKLARYIKQTHLILDAIPRENCPILWDAIKAEIES